MSNQSQHNKITVLPNPGRRLLSDLATSHPEMLVGAVEASPVCVTIADATRADAPLVYANPAFEAMTGYRPDEIIGQNCRFLQGPESDPIAIATLRSAIDWAQPAEVELINYRKDGSPFRNALRLAPVKDGAGRLIAFIGMQHDVTVEREREKHEIERQRLEALGQLAGGVAHQLNNLLQPIISLVSLHRGTLDDQSVASDLDIVLTSARQAADVVRDILSFSQTELGTDACLPIAETVRSNTTFLKSLLPEKIEIDVTVSDRVGDCHVKVDGTRLCQMLANLLINAAQAMNGRGRISIDVDAPNATNVVITVSDNGPGIPPEIQSRVFEPFFTTKSGHGGTGLGLSMVYGIVRSLGGTVRIENTNGQTGCRILMNLPCNQSGTERTP